MKKYFFILFSALIAFACTDNGYRESAKISAHLPDSLLKERWKVILFYVVVMILSASL